MYDHITANQMHRDYIVAAYNMGELVPAYERRSPRDMAADFAMERGIHLPDFFGKTRTRNVAHARQDCMAMLHRETSLTLQQIGHVMGGRDHTTVLHGIKASERRAAE